ncbi:MAG: extracellular solute-binding protein [Anaerolineales bacterium]|nr:extracellular solute-binding protein [Anaerolineales bacterium]
MIRSITRFLPILAFIPLFIACEEIPFDSATPVVTPLPTATPTTLPQPTAPLVRTVTLQVWVPPQFAPSNSSPASQILQARLDEFTEQRPRVYVDVRVKAVSGPGGLLDALSSTSTAAPLALPDLIALPHNYLEEAALKGLLSPYNGLTTIMEEDDWYEYAQQLSQLQTTTFGLPFVGDALVMLYRPAEISDPPSNWTTLLEIDDILAFPADDDQSLFTLAQYLAAGGQIRDDEGRPMLDLNSLTNVLAFIQSAEDVGVMPFWLTQYSNYDQTMQAYHDSRSNLVVSWISHYLSELPVDSNLTTLPTNNGQPFTLANGWAWALSNPDPERITLSVELAEFLSSPEFLSEWVAAAGFLPPRSGALDGWRNTNLRTLVNNIAESAKLIPPRDILAAISPALHHATLDVLKDQADAATAALRAIEQLDYP